MGDTSMNGLKLVYKSLQTFFGLTYCTYRKDQLTTCPLHQQPASLPGTVLYNCTNQIKSILVLIPTEQFDNTVVTYNVVNSGFYGESVIR
jgi:hypothetical protein